MDTNYQSNMGNHSVPKISLLLPKVKNIILLLYIILNADFVVRKSVRK